MTQVSVVIPAYNAAATLDRTLASVRAQTHSDLEIIVVDDGSTDGTAALAARHAEEDPRVRLISQGNRGVAAARNNGLESAAHEWVALLDADDIWHPETVERFISAVEAAPEPVTFVYTWSRRIDEKDRVIVDLGRPRYAGDVLVQLVVANFTRNASSSMLNRAASLKVGGYDSGLQAAGAHGAEDIDLYLRLAAIGPATVAEGFHVGYRQIRGSMSQNAHRMRRSVELALEKAEKEQKHLPPALFEAARANYDLYAAGLSFTSGRWGDLLGYIGKALRRRPVYAAIYLGIVGPYSLASKFWSGQAPLFSDLDPAQPYSWPLADVIMSVQDRFFRRIQPSGRLKQA